MADRKKMEIVSENRRRNLARRLEILRMEPEKALAAIIEESEPLPLVHSIPEEDFFILMHDVGVNDFLPVLAMANDRQWEHVLDMEIWDSDRINPASLGKWLDILMKADAPRLVKWLMGPRIDIAEYYLNQNIELRIREHDQDPSDFGDGFTSFDNVFYFRLRPPEYSGITLDQEAAQDRAHLADSMLKGFASLDYPRMIAMLQESQAILAVEEEEELFRLRNINLSEKGFVSFDEALGVYQPLSAWESPETGRRDGHLPYDEPSLSFLPSMILSGSGFFKDLPVSFDKIELPEGFENEMAALCNRIVVADHKIIRSRDELRQTVAKACGYITLGVNEISDKMSAQPEDIFSGISLGYLFRAGYSRVVSIQRQARQWIEKSWFRKNGVPLSFWGEEWMGVLGGLLLKRPLYFCNYESGLLYRDFRHEEDIEKTSKSLESMMAIDSIFEGMGLSVPGTGGQLLQAAPFILTMWANSWLERSGGEFMVPVDLFKVFYDALFDQGRIKPEMKENFVEWISSAASIGLSEIFERIWFVFEGLFRDIESEYRDVSAADLDPRFIRYFYVM